MDVAFIGEFTGGERVFRYVDASLDACPVQPGGSDPLEDTYCQRVVDGRLPMVIPDTVAIPEAAALPVPKELPVGAHLSVPVTLADGSLYGTLCAFSRDPNPRLGESDVGALRLVATLLGNTRSKQATARAKRARDAAQVGAVLTAREFTTVFQPVVDLEAGHPVGFEALTRFRHGVPDEWFAKAADAGLGVSLELAALHAAVEHLGDVPGDAYLAVNLSPAVLCSSQFGDQAGDLPLHRLVIDLIEHTSSIPYADMLSPMAWLRASGARIAVDDAGSGYAGLQRILALSPDVLKLDRQLISRIDIDPARQALALAMTLFARRTGATLVAEGIENRSELDMLISLGVRHGQGYHLGRPAPLR